MFLILQRSHLWTGRLETDKFRGCPSRLGGGASFCYLDEGDARTKAAMVQSGCGRSAPLIRRESRLASMTTDTTQSSTPVTGESNRDLSVHGLKPSGEVSWNLSPAELYEESLRRGDGELVHMGAIATVTAPHTGRSPNDLSLIHISEPTRPY